MVKRIAFVCRGKSKDFKDKGWSTLDSLQTNVKKVSNALKKYGRWDVEPFALDNSDTVSKKIKSLENSRDTEVLFYYTGHGKKTTDGEYILVGETTESILFDNITKIMRLEKGLINFTVIIDACHSGEVLEDFKIKHNIEFLSSTGSFKQFEKKFGNDTMSSLSYHLCTYLRENEQENITLEDIHTCFAGKEPEQNARHLKVTDRFLNKTIISYPSQQEKLKELKDDLAKILSLDKLRLYATNLLTFDYIDLPETFDEIVDYLYRHRQPLLCMLKNLNHSTLALHMQKLQDELHYSDEDIKQFDCMKKDMKKQKCNLLIVLNPADDKIETTEVEIWEYKKPDAELLYADTVNLKDNVQLIDEIFRHVKISRTDVLLEFIIPQELMNQNIGSWKNSEGVSLKERFNIVRRLYERIEKSRLRQSTMKEWKEFWGYYRNKAEEILPACATDRIDFYELEEKPYIKLTERLESEGIYKKLIDESACIVLAQMPNGNISDIDTLCCEINKTQRKLKELVNMSFRSSRIGISYLLIWDNPNRIPPKNKNENQKNSTIGA